MRYIVNMRSLFVRFCFLKFCYFEVQGLSSSAPILKPTVSSPSHDVIKAASISADASSTVWDVSLYSLQWTPDDRISLPVRKVWKWKDSVLGDGRDFFVPKPKTIQKLQTILLNHLSGLRECSVLSNCARLEVLCVWNQEEDDSSPIISRDERRLQELSSCLLHQIDFYDSTKNRFVASLTQSLDRPNVLSTDSTATIQSDSKNVKDLSRHWTSYSDLSDILLHLCQISAGMATRPRRPERQVVFRPFSSRDAHILLQLKRTKEVVSKNNGVLNQLLEYATRAGKAARNDNLVPALSKLKGYGDGSSKYSTSDPPLDLSRQVQQVVLEEAIQPLVQECIEKLRIASRKDAIANFRQAAEALATTKEESIHVRKLLHQPTMELRRNPDTARIEQALQAIEEELIFLRRQ